MLRLKRLEVQGFGPFAEMQTIEFAPRGVTVVYGENMRGKTSLLNAIRYAFFGTVLGRGSRTRKLHTLSNRELAAEGTYGFSIALTFDYYDTEYELVRECTPRVAKPATDADYEEKVLLRRGTATLGPQERERALLQIFPREISRFFLFDGELLQEYEELLINESEVGLRISEAIERILGMPILKNGRKHLTQMSEEADKQAAKEASKQQETQAMGDALQLATDQKAAHQQEIVRLQGQLQELNATRAEVEQYLQSVQKYAAILEERDQRSTRQDEAKQEQAFCVAQLQQAMADAWRTVVRDTVRAARVAAQGDAQAQLDGILLSLRAKAIDAGHCDTCEQDIPPEQLTVLKASVPKVDPNASANVSATMSRLADLNKFRDSDNAGQVRELWKRNQELHFEQTALRDRITDLTAALAESDPETVRRSKASFAEVIEKISAVKKALEDENRKATEIDQNIQRIKKRLEAVANLDLKAGQARSKLLRDAAEVFAAAVEQHKIDLRRDVERTASDLFLAMTTEETDYKGLAINDAYGLSIQHLDGRAEEARSAGAEHIVALALMGALQRNAPLRGPIVMDSPFGRLDEKHTSNVVKSLPKMADQVVLLVYESEVGMGRMRDLLKASLSREYQLDRVSARRTRVTEIK